MRPQIVVPLAATLIVVACGGAVDPSPLVGAFPRVDGCMGDEIVRPRGVARLLAEVPDSSSEFSADDERIYKPPYVISRATGVVTTESELRPFASYSGGWFYDVSGGTAIVGEIGSPGATIDDSPTSRNLGRPVTTTIFTYLAAPKGGSGSYPFSRWWDRGNGSRGELAAPPCERSHALVLAGRTLVWAESTVPWPCGGKSKEPGLRIHFRKAGGEIVTLAPGVGSSAEGSTFSNLDANSSTAVASWSYPLEQHVIRADGSVRRTTSLILATPVVTRDAIYFVTSNSSTVVGYPPAMTDPPIGYGTVDGSEPVGLRTTSYHDRHGAYWFRHDDARNVYRVWTLDFDFLGCPPD